MKKLLAAAAVAMTVATGPAFAVTLDISTLKCSDIADFKPDELGMILVWIDGYLGGAGDDTRLDIDRFNTNADAAAEACKEDPSAGLLTVIKAAEAQ